MSIQGHSLDGSAHISSPSARSAARASRSRRLRVAMLMSSASRLNAGVFEAARGLSHALAQEADLQIEVFAAEDRFTEDDRPRWNEVVVHAFPRLGPAGFSYAPLLAEGLADFAPDIVHVHGLWTYSSLVAQHLAVRRGARTIVSAHGMLTPWALKHKALKKALALRVYERRNLERATCIHALTLLEARSVAAQGFERPICVIPNGMPAPCSVRRFREGRGESDCRELLYLGRLHPVKGIEDLLRGWALFKASGDSPSAQWRLMLVGGGETAYRARLETMVGDLAVADSVTFCGPRYGEALWDAFARADAFILTSHSEAMPMAVLEAWCAELPVVMTPECGLPEGVAAGAAMETSIEPGEIAATLCALTRLTDEERYRMGRIGAAMVEERFSWEEVARSFTNVYSWLAGEGGRPASVLS